MDKVSLPSFPIVGGGPSPDPSFVAVIQDATWWALGQPRPDRIYVSTQGDWWDLIAIRVYGRVRGNEHLMYRLLEENPALRELVAFPGGVAVSVPDVPVTSEIPLVPWKSATTGKPTAGPTPGNTP